MNKKKKKKKNKLNVMVVLVKRVLKKWRDGLSYAQRNHTNL